MPGSRPKRRGGAEGAVWRRIVKAVVSRDFGVCWICGHPGSKSADHVISVTERPDLAMEFTNLKAAHSYPGGCDTCSASSLARGGKRIHCNEIKQGMSVERARRVIESRTGLSLGLSEGKPRPASGERAWD